MDEKQATPRRRMIEFAIGLAVGIIFYKVVSEVLWPMLFN